MTAAIYLRKSRAEENEPVSDTLARHKNTLMEFAAANSITIADSYEEVVSGDSLFARPAMLKLLDNISLYGAVLCMDIDRLGRGNMKEQGIILEALKDADVKIITPRKTYDLNNEMDETYGEFQAFMARQELKLIKNRMQRGIRRSAEEGYHMGPPPYGYVYTRQGKRAVLEPLPEEAEIVKLIFGMYLQGNGVNKIAGHLNGMGIKPRKASKWFPVSVRRILNNDVYAGRCTYGKLMKSKSPGVKKTFRPMEQRINSPGVHTGLVAPEDYQRVQEIITMKYRPPTADYRAIKNPMAGLIKCQDCGHALHIHHTKGKYYLLCKTAGCSRMANMDYIEAAVIHELQKHLIELEATPSEEAAAPDTEAIIAGMEKELDKLAGQKEKLHDLLEQGVYTIDVYQERMLRIQERMGVLEASLTEVKSRANAQNEVRTVLIPRIHSLMETYHGSDAKTKNELLKSVVRRITYAKARDAAPTDFTVWVELLAF